MYKFIQADESGVPVEISTDNHPIITASGYPPLIKQKVKIFSQFFLNGTSNDLGIDGSVAESEFCINADEDNDIYLTRITFILGYGGSGEMYEFADSGAALTNGVKVFYFDSFGDEVTIMNPKANLSFMRASGIPVTNTNWETRGFAARGDYGYFVNISLTDLMPPYGIKLDRGTKQRACIIIRDDCTDADLFNCNAFGFERLP